MWAKRLEGVAFIERETGMRRVLLVLAVMFGTLMLSAPQAEAARYARRPVLRGAARVALGVGVGYGLSRAYGGYGRGYGYGYPYGGYGYRGYGYGGYGYRPGFGIGFY